MLQIAFIRENQEKVIKALAKRNMDAKVTVDEVVIDGAVRGVGAMAVGSGSTLRRTQSGYVRSYAALILIGAVALLGAIWVVTQ